MNISTVATLFAIVSAIIAIVSAFLGYKKGLKQEGSSEGSLRSDVGYIKAGVDDLKAEQKLQSQRHYELSDTVARIDESTKSAHHRIDGIEDRVNRLEVKGG